MPWKRYSEGSAIQKSLSSSRESTSRHRVGKILHDVFPLNKRTVNLQPTPSFSSLNMISHIKKGDPKMQLAAGTLRSLVIPRPTAYSQTPRATTDP
jgi:hypothetical protein